MKPVVIVVDNAVRIVTKDLSIEIVDSLKLAFTFDNPDFTFKRLLKLPGWWKEPKDVGMWQENGDHLILPRGCLRKARDVLEENDILYKIRDRRTEGGLCPDFPKYIGPPLRYYQEDGLLAATEKQNCVIRMPTASGKSLLAMALASRIGLNTLVILPTVALFKQWCDDVRDSLQMRPEDLGIIHQKKRSLRPITAAVQGTLASRGIDEEMKEFFGVIIVDECQKSAAASYVRVVDPFPAKYRIGISADERRKDRKEYLTNGLFGPPAYEIKRKKLEDEGFVIDVEIRILITNFRADWYGLTKKKDEWDMGEEVEEKEVDFDRLLKEMTSDEERNDLFLHHALEEARAGEQVIILSHRREHCLHLDRFFVKHQIPSGFFIGGADYGVEFEKTRAGIKDGSIRVGVGTYGALGVGVNLPAVGVGIATTPIGGNRFMFNQVRGRLSRLSSGTGKRTARLYVPVDVLVYPKHLQNIVSWNPTVKVLDKGRWVEAKQYLKSRKKRVG